MKLTRLRNVQTWPTKTQLVMGREITLVLEERSSISVTWVSRADLEDTIAGQEKEKSSSGTLGKTGKN